MQRGFGDASRRLARGEHRSGEVDSIGNRLNAIPNCLSAQFEMLRQDIRMLVHVVVAIDATLTALTTPR